MKIRFTSRALAVTLIGCAVCSAPVPALAQEPRADTAYEERRTPIDAWITHPREIDLSPEQQERIDELKAEYLEEFDELGGDNEMAVVMQALGLERKYRELVRSVLTPEQQNVFDENVTADAQRADTAYEGNRSTPIDAWITRPREIDLSPEQQERIDELKAEYLEEFDELGGDNEMAVVMQALGLERKYRELVRSLLTPEQQAVFEENVRKGG